MASSTRPKLASTEWLTRCHLKIHRSHSYRAFALKRGVGKHFKLFVVRSATQFGLKSFKCTPTDFLPPNTYSEGVWGRFPKIPTGSLGAQLREINGQSLHFCRLLADLVVFTLSIYGNSPAKRTPSGRFHFDGRISVSVSCIKKHSGQRMFLCLLPIEILLIYLH